MYIKQQLPTVGAQSAQTLAPQTQSSGAAAYLAVLNKSQTAQKPQLMINPLFQLSSTQEKLADSNTTFANLDDLIGSGATRVNPLDSSKPTALQAILIQNLAKSLAAQEGKSLSQPVRLLPASHKTVDVTPILG